MTLPISVSTVGGIRLSSLFSPTLVCLTNGLSWRIARERSHNRAGGVFRWRGSGYMLHQVLIILHTVCAVLSFGFGYLAVLPRMTQESRRRWFSYYLITLIGMIVSLAGAIAAHVPQLAATVRGIFSGLFILSLYMLFRAAQARSALFSQRDSWFIGYVDHIGFTLIALFEGFVIVSGIDLGAPGWLIAAAAVLGVVAGNVVVRRLQTAASQPAEPSHAH